MMEMKDYVLTVFGALYAAVMFLLKRDIGRTDKQIETLQKADAEHFKQLSEMLSTTRVMESKISEQTGQFREIILHQNEKIEFMLKPVLLGQSHLSDSIKEVKESHSKSIEAIKTSFDASVKEINRTLADKKDMTHNKKPA